MVAAHQRYVVNSVDDFVGNQDGSILIHSFGPWSGVGVAVAERLRKRGIQAVPIVTAFGTYNHETRGKLRGIRRSSISPAWFQYEWELLWTIIAVDPSERRGYQGSKVVLVNYESVREIILRQFGKNISFRKMNYASEAAFLKVGTKRGELPQALARLEPKGAPLIIAASRHDPRKGVDVLLRALVALRKKDIQFRSCLIGGGLLLEKHRTFVERGGLLASTAVLGRVPDAYTYLAHADVFVLPSLEEGSGSVALLEAMQAGAAAVVSRVDGVPEDVIDGQSALLVPPGDDIALAGALGRLISDHDLRARIAHASYQQYQRRFSAEAFVADLQRVYSDLGFPPLARATPLVAT
jgi:glycosyltransferase involved in cell wall biosynthesis